MPNANCYPRPSSSWRFRTCPTQIIGLSVYSAFVVADPMSVTGVGTIPPSLTITIQ